MFYYRGQFVRAEVAVELPNLDIEQIYQERLQRMSPAEKFARSAAMFQWTRDQISRQILQERGAIEAEELKWLVALRLYGDEPQARMLIESQLAKYVSNRSLSGNADKANDNS